MIYDNREGRVGGRGELIYRADTRSHGGGGGGVIELLLNVSRNNSNEMFFTEKSANDSIMQHSRRNSP